MFHLLISLNFSTIGPVIDQCVESHVFQLILQAHCIQTLVNIIISDESGENNDLEQLSQNNKLVEKPLKKLIDAIGNENSQLILTDVHNFDRVKFLFECSLQRFLRCSAIYYSNLYHVTLQKCNSSNVGSDKEEMTVLEELLMFFGLEETFDECLSLDNDSVKFLCKK